MKLELPSAVKDLWAQLGPRERWLAGVGAGVVALVALYTLTWIPIQRDLARLRAAAPKAQQQLAWMRAQAPLAREFRGRGTPGSTNLTVTLEQTASAQSLKPASIELDGTHGARVKLEAVSFNALVTWLADLQKNHGLLVDDAQIDAHATAGLVNARLRLRAAG
jgi:general secretion pathway protein M